MFYSNTTSWDMLSLQPLQDIPWRKAYFPKSLGMLSSQYSQDISWGKKYITKSLSNINYDSLKSTFDGLTSNYHDLANSLSIIHIQDKVQALFRMVADQLYANRETLVVVAAGIATAYCIYKVGEYWLDNAMIESNKARMLSRYTAHDSIVPDKHLFDESTNDIEIMESNKENLFSRYKAHDFIEYDYRVLSTSRNTNKANLLMFNNINEGVPSVPDNINEGVPLLPNNFNEGDPLLPNNFNEGDPLLPNNFNEGDPLLPNNFNEGDPLLPNNFNEGAPLVPNMRPTLIL